jgi:pimeloyl-ACP methyl ester carboxylesterase
MLALAVWMMVRAHRHLHSRSRSWLLYPVISLLALASIGGGYETVREAVDARAYPMPGQLIDVGGHRLHLSCTGSGSPTVVLEPGGGEMSSSLGWIAPAVARGTRVCVYDRAGRGWSDPAATAQHGRQIATDLHTLLQHGNVPGPYVLAGHSFGGLYVLTFAARYPDEVAGMVLVDSTAPASAATPGKASPGAGGSYDDVMSRVSALGSAGARLGLGRLYGQVAVGSLPPRSRDEVRASLATARNVRSTIEEYVQASASVAQAASLRDFGDKPLVVLTAGTGSDAAWSAAQDDLAGLSTNSAHRVIGDATHDALVANEDDAATTTQAFSTSSPRSKAQGRFPVSDGWPRTSSHRSLAGRPVAPASLGEALGLPVVHIAHPLPAGLGRWPDPRVAGIVAVAQGVHVRPILVDPCVYLISAADGPVARDEDIDVVRHALQQPQRCEVVLDRVVGAVQVVEHRNQDIRQHVAGHENPAFLNQQCRMARGMRLVLDDPDLRTIPGNLRSSGGQSGDEAEQVQWYLVGDFWW